MPKKKSVAVVKSKKAAPKNAAAKTKAVKKPAVAVKSKVKAKAAVAVKPKNKVVAKPKKAAKKFAAKKPQKVTPRPKPKPMLASKTLKAVAKKLAKPSAKKISKPVKKRVTKAAILAGRMAPKPFPRSRAKSTTPKIDIPKRKPRKASGLKLYAKLLRKALAVKKPPGPQLELLLRAEYSETGRVSKDAERLLGVSRKVH